MENYLYTTDAKINVSMPVGFPVLAIIHVAFGLILFVYWILSFVILYHLTRFGIGTQPKKFAAIFLFGSVVIATAALVLFIRLDVNHLLSLINT